MYPMFQLYYMCIGLLIINQTFKSDRNVRARVDNGQYREHIERFRCVPVVTMGSRTLHLDHRVVPASSLMTKGVETEDTAVIMMVMKVLSG